MKINKFLLFSMVLTSCSVGPDYQRPQNFSDEQLFAATGAKKEAKKISKEWYKEFLDPVLNKLISQGLSDNLNIKIVTI